MEKVRRKACIGIIAVASQDESGGERAESLIAAAKAEMEKTGVDVVCGSKVIWNPADAVEVCDNIKDKGIDAVVILHATWILDSLSYLIVNKLSVPVVLWAVPYTETFSFACVQHMSSVLKSRGVKSKFVYGLPEDKALIDELRLTAESALMCKLAEEMNIALLGPRQTWRVAGPQDMSAEEWNFSDYFGTTIVHLEMTELLKKVDVMSDADADVVLAQLKDRTGKVLCTDEDMKYAAKVYASMKELMKENKLDAVAAECYPSFDGITNLTASWLADERVVVETEGDISHVMVKQLLNLCSDEGSTLLGEIGSILKDDNAILISHGGSSGHFTANTVEEVEIHHSGDTGTYVGTPVRAMEKVTVAGMVGDNGKYKMLIGRGETLPVTKEEWDAADNRLLVKLRFAGQVQDVIDTMIEKGVDHHVVIREGDFAKELEGFCDFMGVEKVII